ncbi:hypothetical protein [Desulfovibrio litoralis]|uniref:Uncharacterized protein n=1 Tax=Desulfovibrio litoralis DSM 11393 TaxID=1121455 RepID=A0A1M7TPY4_9BACT|nr:hypothetical protein [Desulfovibrio litoralis]SHN72802.1 hypothetical protein SAMN02745728_02354 [Desulfovibrio litoralis DSM 11393]
MGFSDANCLTILFNLDNKKAKQVAEALATAKFGKNIILDGNKISSDFQKKERIKTVVEKKQGLGR